MNASVESHVKNKVLDFLQKREASGSFVVSLCPWYFSIRRSHVNISR